MKEYTLIVSLSLHSKLVCFFNLVVFPSLILALSTKHKSLLD